jgi:hypothetical protein
MLCLERGYFENYENAEGIELFLTMGGLSLEPNFFTMTSVISHCGLGLMLADSPTALTLELRLNCLASPFFDLFSVQVPFSIVHQVPPGVTLVNVSLFCPISF